MSQSAEDIAWAAGLFEGEGSITQSGGRVRLSLKMTDEEPVRRFAKIIQRGTVYGPYAYERRADGHERKPFWAWVCYDRAEAGVTIERLAPWLSTRRLARAHELGIYP